MRTTTHQIGLSFALLAVLASGASGQTAAPSEQDQVRAVIQRLFDGMREADSGKVRSTFAPGGRMVRVGTRANPDTIIFDSPDAWLAAVARSNKSWDERPSNIHIDVDGNLASAWMDYTFRLNGAMSHCGIDSFDFVKSKGEWKITQLGDTQKRTGCGSP
jgi:hypothetical protein